MKAATGLTVVYGAVRGALDAETDRLLNAPGDAEARGKRQAYAIVRGWIERVAEQAHVDLTLPPIGDVE